MYFPINGEFLLKKGKFLKGEEFSECIMSL
jgi:hypothetical protein